MTVIRALPQLEKLDDIAITAAEKQGSIKSLKNYIFTVYCVVNFTIPTGLVFSKILFVRCCFIVNTHYTKRFFYFHI